MQPAEPDDLKLIVGIGPQIEIVLNDFGVYRFAQIAGWSEPEREWVDKRLMLLGRSERDEWIRQAKALADGGEEEYVRVFGRKPR